MIHHAPIVVNYGHRCPECGAVYLSGEYHGHPDKRACSRGLYEVESKDAEWGPLKEPYIIAGITGRRAA